MSTVVRYSLPDVPVTHVAASVSGPPQHSQMAGPSSSYDSEHGGSSKPRSSHDARGRLPSPTPTNHSRAPQSVHEQTNVYGHRDNTFEEEEGDERQSPLPDDDSEGGREGGGRALLMSNLQNPNDALRLLASASSLRYTTGGGETNAASPPSLGGVSPWNWWSPVEEGWLSEQEAAALLCL